jgi:hypothetical protein
MRGSSVPECARQGVRARGPPDDLQHGEHGGHRAAAAVVRAGQQAAQLRVPPPVRQQQVLAGGRELQRGEALRGAQALRAQRPPRRWALQRQHAQLVHELQMLGARGLLGCGLGAAGGGKGGPISTQPDPPA